MDTGTSDMQAPTAVRIGGSFSLSYFSLCIALVLVGFLAFPLYQAVSTGGPVFYINGIDESSYLSYPYATYVREVFGNHRLSSVLVVWLHQHGLSGGYCNALFDVLTSIGILVGLYRLFVTLGYDGNDARRGAIVAFLAPLLFSPTNPVFDILRWVTLSDALIQWSTSPFNPELPFARTPEPQLSWLLVIVWLNLFARSRLLPFAALVIVPLLYSFIRLPFLFSCVAAIGASRVRLPARLILSWLIVGACMAIFLRAQGNLQSHWLLVQSWLPMISVMGLTALGFFFFLRGRVPPALAPILPILVASTWVGPNIQVISGALAAPVNYEQYWSIVIVGFLCTVAILSHSTRKNLWVIVVVVVFAIQSVLSFAQNYRVTSQLHDPRAALALVRTSAERVAVNNLLLAAYLDMAYPQQPATSFSFAKTYDITSDRSYHHYLCARRFIETHSPDQAPAFAALFAKLDYGYQVRGMDPLATAGRVAIPKRSLAGLSSELECTEAVPLVLGTTSELLLSHE